MRTNRLILFYIIILLMSRFVTNTTHPLIENANELSNANALCKIEYKIQAHN